MSDLDALLAAVIKFPAEDTPRLMYADAVRETDPERADLIEKQIELARLEPESAILSAQPAALVWGATDPPTEDMREIWPRVCRAATLVKELRNLLTKDNINRWTATGGLVSEWDFSRGFQAGVYCSWAMWREKVGAWCRAAPLERVRLRRYPRIEVRPGVGKYSDDVCLSYDPYRIWFDVNDVHRAHPPDENYAKTLLEMRYPGVKFDEARRTPVSHIPVAPAARRG